MKPVDSRNNFSNPDNIHILLREYTVSEIHDFIERLKKIPTGQYFWQRDPMPKFLTDDRDLLVKNATKTIQGITDVGSCYSEDFGEYRYKLSTTKEKAWEHFSFLLEVFEQAETFFLILRKTCNYGVREWEKPFLHCLLSFMKEIEHRYFPPSKPLRRFSRPNLTPESSRYACNM